jgi:hypothetical protein
MSRIFKHYNFQLNGQQWKTRLTSMSSYPGEIPPWSSQAAHLNLPMLGGHATMCLVMAAWFIQAYCIIRVLLMIPDCLCSTVISSLAYHKCQHC